MILPAVRVSRLPIYSMQVRFLGEARVPDNLPHQASSAENALLFAAQDVRREFAMARSTSYQFIALVPLLAGVSVPSPGPALRSARGTSGGTLDRTR